MVKILITTIHGLHVVFRYCSLSKILLFFLLNRGSYHTARDNNDDDADKVEVDDNDVGDYDGNDN